jgi:lipopolysaccharide assembly protein A
MPVAPWATDRAVEAGTPRHIDILERETPMRWLKGLILAIILLAVLLVGILFAVNNQQTLPLNLIWLELPAASLSVWLLASLTVGVLLGMLAMIGVYLRLRTRLTRAQRHNQQQRKELDRLRIQELKEVP